MGRLIQFGFRRDSSANWASGNPVLAAGEPGYETSTQRLKIGDGSTAWSALPYAGFPPGGFTPTSGGWMIPETVMSTAAGPIDSQAAVFHRFRIGPQPLTLQALGCVVGTAQVGGSTTTYLGVYPDNGTGGQPDCSGGPLASGTVTLTSTGARTASVSVTLQPGLYWGCFLYVQSSAPSTVATVHSPNNSTTMWVSNSNFTAGTLTSRFLSVGGKTVLPTTSTSPGPVFNSHGALCLLQAA